MGGLFCCCCCCCCACFLLLFWLLLLLGVLLLLTTPLPPFLLFFDFGALSGTFLFFFILAITSGGRAWLFCGSQDEYSMPRGKLDGAWATPGARSRDTYSQPISRDILVYVQSHRKQLDRANGRVLQGRRPWIVRIILRCSLLKFYTCVELSTLKLTGFVLLNLSLMLRTRHSSKRRRTNMIQKRRIPILVNQKGTPLANKKS